METKKVSPIHSVCTPIGVLDFSATSEHGEILNAQIKSCPIEPKLPNGMVVEGCVAVLLQYVPLEELVGLTFRCRWKQLKEKGDVCSGEALDAWEWKHEGTLVVIGTEDNEWLSRRLRFVELTETVHAYPITMRYNVVEIRVPLVPVGEQISLHYIVAWNSLPEKKESSCWYAVDVPHEMVRLACE